MLSGRVVALLVAVVIVSNRLAALLIAVEAGISSFGIGRGVAAGGFLGVTHGIGDGGGDTCGDNLGVEGKRADRSPATTMKLVSYG